MKYHFYRLVEERQHGSVYEDIEERKYHLMQDPRWVFGGYQALAHDKYCNNYMVCWDFLPEAVYTEGWRDACDWRKPSRIVLLERSPVYIDSMVNAHGEEVELYGAGDSVLAVLGSAERRFPDGGAAFKALSKMGFIYQAGGKYDV